LFVHYRRVVRLSPRRVVVLVARTAAFFLPVVLTLSLSVTCILGRRLVRFLAELGFDREHISAMTSALSS
jgi:hypothetical protein